MAASASDKLMKVGSPGTATTLSSPGYTSGVSTSINVASTTNWPTDTGVIFAIDEATTNAAGEEVRVDGTYNEFEGTVASATQITNVDYKAGDAERSYSAGSTTRVYVPVSSERENRIVDWGVVEHNQDGTHDEALINSRTLITSTQTTDHVLVADDSDSDTLKKVALDNLLADGSVTPAKLSFSGCSASKITSSQTMTNGNFIAVTFNDEFFDTDNYHDNSTNPSRMTVSATGKYRLTATLNWTANVTGSRIIVFRINGTSTDRLGYQLGSSSGTGATAMQLTTTTLVNMTAGDYAEVFAFQNSGTDLSMSQETSNNGVCRFIIERVA